MRIKQLASVGEKVNKVMLPISGSFDVKATAICFSGGKKNYGTLPCYFVNKSLFFDFTQDAEKDLAKKEAKRLMRRNPGKTPGIG